MRNLSFFQFFLIFISLSVNAQFPFEKFKAVKYDTYEWETHESKYSVSHNLSIPDFYKKGGDMSIKILCFMKDKRKSEISIYGLAKREKLYLDDIPFTSIGLDSLRVTDINGDGLKDIKITSYYMGCGLASLNARILYLFQKKNGKFTHISFDDMIGSNYIERDFDGDSNFEILTMNLEWHREHSYWIFNIYNLKNDKLVNVNYKANYPIMIQYLYRDNFKITKNLTRQQMKNFEKLLPQGYFQETK
jgi:hypothetical protein